MKYIKQKALFEIFLIISLSFYTSLYFNSLKNNNLENKIINNEDKINYFDLIKQDFIPDVDAQTSKGCCELTKISSPYAGLSCVFTELSDCEATKNGRTYQSSPFACEQTDFCGKGVCKLQGTCQDNVEKGLCIQKGGTWNSGNSQNDPQCKLGCCDLPSGAALTTQAQCSDKVKIFPGIRLGDVFKSNIQDEPTCLAQSKSNEEGCCVITSQNQCKFGTRKECNDLQGEFKLNNLCSNPNLGCQATAKHGTTCYQNKVYWLDSAGNRENVYDGKFDSSWQNTNWMNVDPNTIAKLSPDPSRLSEIADSGNCQFSLNTICGKVSDKLKNYLRTNKGLQENDVAKIQNQCISLDCYDTQENELISWMGGDKRNGESWCEYQNIVGNGQDLVGSRHFIHRCDNGAEVVEECLTRRKEICVQGKIKADLIYGTGTTQKDLLSAKCTPNNWNLCLAANADNENCGIDIINDIDAAKSKYKKVLDTDDINIDNGPCAVYVKKNKQIHDGKGTDFISCVKKLACRQKSCEEEVAGNCYFNKNIGQCAPSVPPGTLGKENDFKELSNGNNIGFSVEQKMYFQETNFLGGDPEWDEDCQEGCTINDANYASKWNSFCTSLGDLGNKYNVEGYYSTKGFYHNGPYKVNDVDEINWNEASAKQVDKKQDFNFYKSNIKELSGNIYSLLSNIETFSLVNYEKLRNDPDFRANFFESANAYASYYTTGGITAISLIFGTGLLTGGFVTGLGVSLASTLGLITTSALTTVSTGGLLVPGGSIAFGGSLVGSAGGTGLFAATFFAVLTTLVIIAAAAIILTFILNALFPQNSGDLTYKIQCMPWVPPAKGEFCNECNDKSKYRTCDEYLCLSLGKSCTLFNKGSPGNETCIWKNQGDSDAPIIAPLIIAPFTDNDVEKVPPSTGYTGGYKFKKNITAFTSITIGIKIIDKDDATKNDFAECKISRNNNFNYDDTSVQFFEDSLTKPKHVRALEVSQTSLAPNEDRIELVAGMTNTFYIKCKDANDNKNIKPYFIEIPVSQGPDTAPPIIKQFSIKNNAFIPYNINQTDLMIYVEDQSGLENSTSNQTSGLDGGCKYSTVKGQDYNLMPYDLVCTKGKVNLNYYGCLTTLKLKPNQDNIFYFKCRDVKGNTNSLDAPPIEGDTTDGYHLKGSEILKISSSDPKGKVLATDVNLSLTTTIGAENGKSTCYYAGGEKSLITRDLTFSPSGIIFTNTGTTNHETTLSLQNEKDYIFYAWCRDIAGNEDNTTIKFHTTTPDLNITNALPNNEVIYSENVQLKVTTKGGIKNNGQSDCNYKSIGSLNGGQGNINDYKITQGEETTHYKNITLSDGTYQLEIKCTDQYKIDNTTINFQVDIQGIPKIIRIFKQSNELNIITNRKAECHYSPTQNNFKFEEGTLMVTNDNLQHSLQILNSNVYYIKCRDIKTNNIGPSNVNSYIVYP